ncbi:deoxyribonuclease II (macronuclear) [Tetrahymena thermophila SB210]|uniref:Deoxyribonuclease II n=1 Tax=Tetrahymena thermophila (strain SB210) TaxID=312017 RepID=Q22N03_TETTS|nr:deoxyribonuclease II [Tetrahymena thermophila SB210]EAR86610.1 deoxyribonuclease II [Tetrahymena thermophila SB210]|eukprot:XP_976867.1 deoxyribonuclease II [Tetrahymena thermophila SB210]
MMYKTLIAIILALTTVSALNYPTCLDPRGKSVDWFIVLKHPVGSEYSYCDSNSCTQLKSQGFELNDIDNSPLMRTLAQTERIGKQSPYGSVFWNDQPPQSDASLSYAHAKGFMVFNQEKGYLMVHSTPRFPVIEEDIVNLEIPSSQTKFGQHYFCISTTTEDLNKIAEGYNIDYPKVYSSYIPTEFEGIDNIINMVNQKRNKDDQQLAVNFKSLKGTKFIKFSKSGKYLVPFYDTILAESIKAGVIVQSWGSPQEEPICESQYNVSSNMLITLDGITYKQTQDHSKYCISTDDSKPYVCLGDINRQTSQWKRGGGTVCLQNKQVHTAFKKIMAQQQPCSV